MPKKKKSKEPPKITKDDEPIVLRDKVYQTNPLIQARKDFDTLGMRIFLLGLRGINPQLTKGNGYGDEEFETLFIPAAKLSDLLGNDKYLNSIKKDLKPIFNTTICLNHENGGFKLMHIFQTLEYIQRDGLYIKFDDLMRPFLLDLFKSNGYTQISVEQIFRLTSPYAVRLVELLLQYQNIEPMKKRKILERSITIDDLRFFLNVPNNAYQDRFDNFRRFVIDSPIEEINEKTLYKMWYEPEKNGRTPVAFKFFMDVSALPDEKPMVFPGEPAVTKLKALGFSDLAAHTIRDSCDSEADCLRRISSATRSLAMKKRKSVVENELGYLRAYIENNWGVVKPKKTTKPAPSPTTPTPQPQTRSRRKVQQEPVSIGEITEAIVSKLKQQQEPAPEKLPPEKSVSEKPALEISMLEKPAPEKPTVEKSAPEETRGGEKSLSEATIQAFKNAIAANKSIEAVTALLQVWGFTLARFKELYMS